MGENLVLRIPLFFPRSMVVRNSFYLREVVLFCKILCVFLVVLFTGTAEAQSVGGTVSGATQLCPNSTNSGFLMLSGHTGTILYWESTIDGGTTWTNIGNPISSYSYSSLTQTTCYRVIVKNGTFPADTSTVACITIFTPSVGGALAGGGVFCTSAPSNTLTLSGNNGNVLNWLYSTDGGISWTSVANTTTSLVYPVITQNTIYAAVVQNGPGCPTDTSSQVSIMIDPLTVPGVIAGSDSVCYLANGDTLLLSGNTGAVLSWLASTDNGTSWSSISNTTNTQVYSDLAQTVWYAVMVKSGVCATDTSSPSVIFVFPPAPVSAGADTTIIKGATIILNGTGAGSALWSPASGLNGDTLFNPSATPTITTTYVLAVTDSNGCVNSDTVQITVKSGEFSGIIANLISPNGDGINDTWYIQGIENFPGNEIIIYNIYGNEVYRQAGYTNNWKGDYKGSLLPDGTYFYVLKFDSVDTVFKGSLDILKNK